jgi:L-ascorbate metabolism protein UlaG (beta-lactamase superfamily)
MKGHKLIIHHLRHATFVIEVEEKVILVDPMLGHKGSIIPFAVLRHRARLNPTVELPSNADTILDKVNHAVITHRHPDHLDRAGVRFLRERSIPVTCSYKDSNRLRKKRAESSNRSQILGKNTLSLRPYYRHSCPSWLWLYRRPDGQCHGLCY